MDTLYHSTNLNCNEKKEICDSANTIAEEVGQVLKNQMSTFNW